MSKRIGDLTPERLALAEQTLSAIDPIVRATIIDAWKAKRLADLQFDRAWAPVRDIVNMLGSLGHDGFMVIWESLKKEGEDLAGRS